MTRELYTPGNIVGQKFFFSGETTAMTSQVETSLARIDESMVGYPYHEALARSLLRIESVATVRSDGIMPDYRVVAYLELAARLKRMASGQEEISRDELKRQVLRWLPACPDQLLNDSYEAFLCFEVAEDILAGYDDEDKITKKAFYEIYDRLMEGSHSKGKSSLRGWNYQIEKDAPRGGVLYLPPSPERLPDLVKDLIEFCNQNIYSPLERGPISHYQLEAIKAFDSGNDRMGRMLSFLMFRKMGLVTNLLPPFSIVPATLTERHTRLLAPYQSGMQYERSKERAQLEEWVYHSAKATSIGIDMIKIYKSRIEELEKKWRKQLSNARRGATLEYVLDTLPGTPVFSIATLSEQVGKNYSTVSEVVKVLQDTGIVRGVHGERRNRVFEATEAILIFETIERSVFPKEAVPREAFFKLYQVHQVDE